MKKLQQAIETLKEREGSYNKVGKKIGLTGSAINHLIHGEVVAKDETVIKICRELKLEPSKMLIETAKDRSKGEAKKYWEKIAKKYESVAAVALLASTLPTFLNSSYCILCKITSFKNSTIFKGQVVTI